MDNNNRWAHLPNHVLAENERAKGIRQPDGQIECQRCTRLVPDNSDRSLGLGASCPHCWVALDVEPNDPGHKNGEPTVDDLLRSLYGK